MKHRRRAAIEPIQGHLKSDYRMAQNCLWGEAGVQINAFMAACAWNLKKWMEKCGENCLSRFFRALFTVDSAPVYSLSFF
jgi:IS5 family transposase